MNIDDDSEFTQPEPSILMEPRIYTYTEIMMIAKALEFVMLVAGVEIPKIPMANAGGSDAIH